MTGHAENNVSSSLIGKINGRSTIHHYIVHLHTEDKVSQVSILAADSHTNSSPIHFHCMLYNIQHAASIYSVYTRGKLC